MSPLAGKVNVGEANVIAPKWDPKAGPYARIQDPRNWHLINLQGRIMDPHCCATRGVYPFFNFIHPSVLYFNHTGTFSE